MLLWLDFTVRSAEEGQLTSIFSDLEMYGSGGGHCFSRHLGSELEVWTLTHTGKPSFDAVAVSLCSLSSRPSNPQHTASEAVPSRTKCSIPRI